MYICIRCGFIYNEKEGWQKHLPGTRWEDVSDDWACPDCGAIKNDFKNGGTKN